MSHDFLVLPDNYNNKKNKMHNYRSEAETAQRAAADISKT